MLKSLNESIDFMSKKFDEYEQKRQEKNEIIDSMIRFSMNKKIEKLERIVDRQE